MHAIWRLQYDTLVQYYTECVTLIQLQRISKAGQEEYDVFYSRLMLLLLTYWQMID